MERNHDIGGILFDNEIEEDSSLAYLPVIKDLVKDKKVSFSKPFIFFIGENGAENLLCRKLLPSPPDSMGKAAPKISVLQPMIPIQNSMNIIKVRLRHSKGTFLGL